MPTDTRRLPTPEDSISPYSYAAEDKADTNLVDDDGRRKDGRHVRQSRPVYMRAGAISQAKGSAYIELDKTKVICAVYGPREVLKKEDFSMKGQLSCQLKFATFSRRYRGQHMQDNTEKDLSVLLQQALEPAVCMDKFPKARVDVFVTVLEDGGGALSAAITCASVALANGGIEMYDLAIATTTRQLGDVCLLDPDTTEEYNAKHGESSTNNGSITVGYMPSIQQVATLTQHGQMDMDIARECIKECISACERIYPILQQALVNAVKLKHSTKT